MANEIRRFTKEDWYGWAGAERFSNNSEPFIYETTLNDNTVEVTIIADANGLGIYLMNRNSEEIAYAKNMPLSSLRAEGELRALVKAVEGFDYAPDLCYAIEHSAWNTENKEFEDFELVYELYGSETND